MSLPIITAEQRLAELSARHAEVSDAYLRAKAEAEGVTVEDIIAGLVKN